ncbi:MAG: hypothetical protein IIA17_11970 [candidate division Zixibacteria bacterium]|nr:hypothetical protein [candidate division Zixibacteria bacterium]
MRKSNTGWRSTEGDYKYAYFIDLTEEEARSVNFFCQDYQQYVLLGLSDNLKDVCEDELDFCLALDYNSDSPESLRHGKRTEIGELIYQIKYRKKIVKSSELVEHLIQALKRILRNKLNGDISISYIPTDRRNKFYLPRSLAGSLIASGRFQEILDSRNPLIETTLIKWKAEAKDLHINMKIKLWENMYTNNNVEIDTDVSGRNIVVVDDLYQSGTTMWLYAKFLKEKGAAQVIGLSCVKTLRDTHN